MKQPKTIHEHGPMKDTVIAKVIKIGKFRSVVCRYPTLCGRDATQSHFKKEADDSSKINCLVCLKLMQPSDRAERGDASLLSRPYLARRGRA